MESKLWRIVAAFILIASLGSVMTTVASATGGPHEGTFAVTTDACAGCHRTHTAIAADLLKSTSQYDLCTSCHDGTGASTDVVTGVYGGTANGTQDAGLRGGGFTQALMNTALSDTFDETGTPVSITSRHTVGATSPMAWGYGSSGNGTPVTTLECGNCHNPHGNSYYRILRPKPTAVSTWETDLTEVYVTTSQSENYTITYISGNYTRDLSTYASSVTSAMGDWCSQCHTRYLAGSGSGSTANTTPYLYRHMTQGLSGECLKCHVAHGTSASMSGIAASGNVTWPDGSTSTGWQTGTEGEYSRLLHIDNRGVCLQCHLSSELTQN